MFANDIDNAAPKNQISSIGFEIAKQANHNSESCTVVRVVAVSPNDEGNERNDERA